MLVDYVVVRRIWWCDVRCAMDGCADATTRPLCERIPRCDGGRQEAIDEPHEQIDVEMYE